MHSRRFAHSCSLDRNIPVRSLPIDRLRTAIHANEIVFPVPVPIFPRQYRADVQWRIAELYFVHGWSPTRLAARYEVSSTRVRQLLRCWVQKALSVGYLQTMPPVSKEAEGSTEQRNDAPLAEPAAPRPRYITGALLSVPRELQAPLQ
jgi:hypothetical protein